MQGERSSPSSSYDVPSILPPSLLSSSSLKGSFSNESMHSTLQISDSSPQNYSEKVRPERQDIHQQKRLMDLSNQEERSNQPRAMNDGQHTGQNRPLERSRSRKSSVKRLASESYSSSDDSQSSDSDRSYDSEDDSFMEVDSMFRGALKSQGQVHDLMLKASKLDLERLRARHERYTQQAAKTAKNIQKTCRSLERTMRIMADQFYAKEGEFGATRGEKRKQRQEEPFSHSSATSQKRTRTPSIQRVTSPIQREMPTVQHETPRSVQRETSAIRHDTAVIQPKPLVVQPAAPIRVDDVKLAASDTLDLLFRLDQTKAQLKYDRKPRSLLYNIAPTSSELRKLMVTTAIDGNMNFWNSEKREVVKTLDKAKLGIDTWAEEICWATQDALGVSVAHKDGKDQPQLCIVNVKDNEQYETSVQALDPKPHMKGISALGSIRYNEDSSGNCNSMIVTGGYDHGLMLWELNKQDRNSEYLPPSVTPLSTRHRSKIQALHYHTHSQTLYSGGADHIMSWYPLDSSSAVDGGQVKLNDRINHILANTVNPHLLLLCMASRTNQMRLYDLRLASEKAVVLSFGCTENDNVSRYLRPDWKPDAWIVSSGNMADHKIHIWDMRYKDVAKGGPSYSWNGHNNRVLRTLFIPGNTMVSIGTDKNTVFTDYSLQVNGHVSGRT